MARTERQTTARRNRGNAREVRGVYVEGNAVRKLQEVPRRSYEPNPNRPQPARKKAKPLPASQRMLRQGRTLSREAQKNRAKAMNMNRGFVLFIAAVSVAVLFCSVNYLRLKSEYTSRMSQVASLESELAELKEDNDAYYSQVTTNVDLNKIRTIAIGRLGMRYPSEDQIMTYTTEGGSYVRQYQDVSEAK